MCVDFDIRPLIDFELCILGNQSDDVTNTTR